MAENIADQLQRYSTFELISCKTTPEQMNAKER